MPTRRRLLRAGLLAAVGGCAGAPPNTVSAPVPRDAIALVLVARGLHTDIGVPAGRVPPALREAWMRGLPQHVQISLGFGQREYMLSSEPGSMEALRALVPSAGVVAIGWLPEQAAEAAGAYDSATLWIDAAGLERLIRHVDADILRDAGGTARAIGGRPQHGRNLFDSTRRYSAAFTCNTWTAEVLHAAGLPFATAGVAWPRDVMRQAHRIAAAQAAR